MCSYRQNGKITKNITRVPKCRSLVISFFTTPANMQTMILWHNSDLTCFKFSAIIAFATLLPCSSGRPSLHHLPHSHFYGSLRLHCSWRKMHYTNGKQKARSFAACHSKMMLALSFFGCERARDMLLPVKIVLFSFAKWHSSSIYWVAVMSRAEAQYE